VILASTVMVPRVIAEVAAVNAELLPAALPPLLLMLAAGIVASLIHFSRLSRAPLPREEVTMRNPFELGQAFRFGLLFALSMLASKVAAHYFGQRGIYATAVLAGTTDMDAVTVSMSRLAAEGTSRQVAVMGIVLGIASNAVVKAALAAGIAGWSFARPFVWASLLMLAAGIAGVYLM